MTSRALAIISLALAVVASLVFEVALWGSEEASALAFLLAPCLVAALPVAIPHNRRIALVAAVGLVAWVVVSAASVGLFYVPSALAMIVAAVRTRALATH